MPSEMRMHLAHPLKDPTGKVYPDYLENAIVIAETEEYPSADALFIYRRHSVIEKGLPHSFPHGIVRIYSRELSIHHQRQAHSGEHVETEISIDPTLDDAFTTSFKRSLRGISKEYRVPVVDTVLTILTQTNPYLLVGINHAILVYNRQELGLVSSFVIDRHGYSIDEKYDDPLIEDSKGKIVGRNPYYIPNLVGTPTSRRPHTIEVSIGEVEVENVRMGVFFGLSMKGTWSEIASSYKNNDFVKRIEDGTMRYRDLPDIASPFLRVRVLP